MRLGPVYSVMMQQVNIFGMGINPAQSLDRLGNPKITFPIGILLSGLDNFNSSVGSDIIVKNNSQFKTGKSQIFFLSKAVHHIWNEKKSKT